jgi:hypothetical protein
LVALGDSRTSGLNPVFSHQFANLPTSEGATQITHCPSRLKDDWLVFVHVVKKKDARIESRDGSVQLATLK